MDLPGKFEALGREQRRQAIADVAEQLRHNPEMVIIINGKPLVPPTIGFHAMTAQMRRVEAYIETGRF